MGSGAAGRVDLCWETSLVSAGKPTVPENITGMLPLGGCRNHYIPMASTPCLAISFFCSLLPLSSPLSLPPSFAPFVAMTHRAARYESTALRALLPCNASFMYINSSIVLSIESNRLLSYKVIAAADRFNPCTYCRANNRSFIFSDSYMNSYKVVWMWIISQEEHGFICVISWSRGIPPASLREVGGSQTLNLWLSPLPDCASN